MSDKTLKVIMKQAQVFASSRSMVGGPFAADDQLERAEDEKLELEKLVTSALEGPVGAPKEIGEMVQALLAWHKRQADQLQIITDNAREGVTLQLGTDDPVEIDPTGAPHPARMATAAAEMVSLVKFLLILVPASSGDLRQR